MNRSGRFAKVWWPPGWKTSLFCPTPLRPLSSRPQLLQAAPTSYLRLRQSLRDYARRHFAFTLIDNPPNMGTFVLQSLYAADGVILPLKAGSAFSVEGLLKAVRLISRVRAEANPDLTFLRLLINQVDRRTSISRNISQEIAGAFEADQLFHTTIPVNTALSWRKQEARPFSNSTPGPAAPGPLRNWPRSSWTSVA